MPNTRLPAVVSVTPVRPKRSLAFVWLTWGIGLGSFTLAGSLALLGSVALVLTQAPLPELQLDLPAFQAEAVAVTPAPALPVMPPAR